MPTSTKVFSIRVQDGSNLPDRLRVMADKYRLPQAEIISLLLNKLEREEVRLDLPGVVAEANLRAQVEDISMRLVMLEARLSPDLAMLETHQKPSPATEVPHPEPAAKEPTTARRGRQPKSNTKR